MADSSWKRDIKELADRVHVRADIPKERETYKTTFGPVIIPQQTTKEDKAMEELTKSFNPVWFLIPEVSYRYSIPTLAQYTVFGPVLFFITVAAGWKVMLLAGDKISGGTLA